MPQIFERYFRVRQYECDPYGHVNHANYLRYMQETAFDASAAVGYDLAWYRAHSRVWHIRETDITYKAPLMYGDTVSVRTWVADFRRVRSRRVYELRKADNAELVAEARTDWVYLDTLTSRPARVPEEMVRAFLPPGERPAAPPREAFPDPPPPPEGVYKSAQPVAWQDLDTQGHVNNAVYLNYMEECGIGVLNAFGWPISRMLAAGMELVARRYRIEYLQPAVLGDQLLISTWASDMKRSTTVRHYLIQRQIDGALLARARVLWVWADTTTGRPIRIPPTLRADFAPNLAS